MPGHARARNVPVFPATEWRSILRNLLRQCSRLPDPIARSACHDQVILRFRRYHEEKRPWLKYNANRQTSVHRQARQSLSILTRANDGYPKPLEKVLQFAYGRTGRRRMEMLAQLLARNVPADSTAVESLIRQSQKFDDDWKPPSIIVDLLKSQNNNPFVAQLSHKPPVRDLQPQLPKKSTWGDEVARCRRKNIRHEWYSNVMAVILPPLPDSELRVLEGLLSGDIPWNSPIKRPQREVRNDLQIGRSIRRVLSRGPAKQDTFGNYVDGRPHTITRRFMQRLWRRISCLTPRASWDATTGRFKFAWDTLKPEQTLAVSTREERSKEVFRNRSDAGPRKNQIKPKQQQQNGWPEVNLTVY